MGDMLSLVEKTQEQVSEEEALALQEKMAKGKMTMDDFLGQLKSIRKMGSMKSLLGMIPGMGSQLKGMDLDDSQLNRTEAIIHSMTKAERADVDLLDTSRRRRIARGSGSSTQEVSQLVKGFTMMSKMSKQMAGMGMMGKLKAMSGLGEMDLAAMGGSDGMPQLPGHGQGGKHQKHHPVNLKSRKRKSR